MYRLTIATMLVLAIAMGGYTQTSRLTTNSSSPSYGKEQADRGKALYSRYCRTTCDNLKDSEVASVDRESEARHVEVKAECILPRTFDNAT